MKRKTEVIRQEREIMHRIKSGEECRRSTREAEGLKKKKTTTCGYVK